jgi:hypothetical protein
VKTKTLLAALLMTIVLAVAGAQPPGTDKKAPPSPEIKAEVHADPKVEERVRELVDQLGDPDFRKRDLASDEIKAEGIKALPVLRASLKNPDAEIRRRLVELIPAIETAAILAPKRITLKMKDKTPNEIFAEFGKQTGYLFDVYHPQPDSKYTVECNNLTFWEAMDRLNKTMGLEQQQGWGDEHVRLQPRNTSEAFVYTDGAFRFRANSFQLYKHVDLTQGNRGAANRSESLTFMFSIQSEPKLPILGIGQAHLTAAFDSEKNSMLIPSNPDDGVQWEGRRVITRYGNGSRMWYQQSQVNLNRVSEKATTVKVLRGTLPMTLLAEQKPHVIADKILEAKGKKAVVGTTTIHVEEVTKVPNTPQFNVRLTFNEDTGGNPNDYSWQNSIYQRLEVLDAKSNKYQIVGQQWGNSNGTSLQVTLTYGPVDQTKKVEGDVKLVFMEWKVLQHQVNFEFKDLPLP